MHPQFYNDKADQGSGGTAPASICGETLGVYCDDEKGEYFCPDHIPDADAKKTTQAAIRKHVGKRKRGDSEQDHTSEGSSTSGADSKRRRGTASAAAVTKVTNVGTHSVANFFVRLPGKNKGATDSGSASNNSKRQQPANVNW
jgi:hypothetical protein